MYRKNEIELLVKENITLIFNRNSNWQSVELSERRLHTESNFSNWSVWNSAQ
jgi:hypothetical protein